MVALGLSAAVELQGRVEVHSPLQLFEALELSRVSPKGSVQQM
jgi:hypothetical protein